MTAPGSDDCLVSEDRRERPGRSAAPGGEAKRPAPLGTCEWGTSFGRQIPHDRSPNLAKNLPGRDTQPGTIVFSLGDRRRRGQLVRSLGRHRSRRYAARPSEFTREAAIDRGPRAVHDPATGDQSDEISNLDFGVCGGWCAGRLGRRRLAQNEGAAPRSRLVEALDADGDGELSGEEIANASVP